MSASVALWRGSSAVMLFVAIGCACSGSGPAAEHSSADRQLMVMVDEITHDDLVGLTHDVHRATQNAMAECMNGEGFDYEPAPYDSVHSGEPVLLDNSAAVEEHGFYLSTTDGTQGPRLENPNDAISAALDERSATLWFGQHAVCQDEARDRVNDELGLDEAIATAERVVTLVDSDAAVVAARREWLGCVRAEGYTAGSPDELREQFAARWEELSHQPSGAEEVGSFRAEELAAAKISFDCAAELREATHEATLAALEAIDRHAYERIYGGD